MVGKTSIRIDKSTLESLRILKIQKNKISYDDVLNEILLKYNMNQQPEKVSNEALMISSLKSSKQILKRVEALHNRFGYYEKEYFLKIVDIADDIADVILPNRVEEKIETVVKNNEEKSNIDYLELEKRYLLLEKTYEESRSLNKNNIKKIQLLKNKFSKKNGVFSSGFDLNLTEGEYNSIFN